MMPIKLDHQLREQITHDATAFPMTFFEGELAALPNQAGPLHWHPEFEIATVENGVLDFQVGQQHLTLDAGNSILINGNTLHGMKQLSGDMPEPMPNIVFSGAVIAPETSAIYQKYIRPIVACDTLPFVVFGPHEHWHRQVSSLAEDIYRHLRERDDGYEMAVQRDLNSIFESVYHHFDALPKSEATRIQINSQIRIQQMLTYIYTHYSKHVTLEDIAGAANISRSEAGRCFHTYMGCSPINALIQYRLQTARGLLNDATLTLQEISHACGFNSVSYFSRQFRKTYGYAPSCHHILGKS